MLGIDHGAELLDLFLGQAAEERLLVVVLILAVSADVRRGRLYL